MQISIIKETNVNEQRVAATPESVKRLIRLGAEVIVEDWRVSKFSSLVFFENENFSDIGNGYWDEGETFYDVGDFIYTCHDDGWNDSTICVDGEDFIDVNQDKLFSGHQLFLYQINNFAIGMWTGLEGLWILVFYSIKTIYLIIP